MKVALTGATGFLGRHLARELSAEGHALRCWYRDERSREGLDDLPASTEWVEGDLGRPEGFDQFVAGCDAVVHAALYHPGGGFRGGEGGLLAFLDLNLMGTIRLVEAARRASAARFVFISSCAVHDRILSDRPLDETHPLWPASHYGAHKAAVEAFVKSYGLGQGYAICALRPTGIYGVARPVERSKWYDLVAAVSRGERLTCQGGGKEVHAADVARAVGLLLQADGIAGESYNCYDRYISELDVARCAQRLSGARGEIVGEPRSPRNQIETAKLRALGMAFGGEALLEQTISQLVEHVQRVRGQ